MTKTKAAPFRLHPALDPAKYEIGPSLARVATWRAHCYSANSGGRTGEMDEVGYVMISKTGDLIIPIARGDEHHRGYDLLYDLSEEIPAIDPSDFVPVWSRGNNYVYGRDEVPDLLNVIGKHLTYGGFDGLLIGSNDLRGRICTLSQFVTAKGLTDLKPASLAPVGTHLVSELTELAAKCATARKDPQSPDAPPAFREAERLARYLLACAGNVHGPDVDALQEAPRAIRILLKARDVQGLEEMFFGPTGFKNGLHNAIRETLANRKRGQSAWNDEKVEAVWGDLELARDMLGRI